jgi:hypothetical protein
MMDGQQCLALHHRRRFSRQRGSISLDGNILLMLFIIRINDGLRNLIKGLRA